MSAGAEGPKPETGAAVERLRQSMRLAWAPASALIQFYWRLLLGILRYAGEILLALIILFEEWGWQPLANVLGRLGRWRLWARSEAAIESLPPYFALIALALPSGLLVPLKLLAVFLIANGHPLAASALFVFAKVAGTAIVARLFQLTYPALMRIGWFAAAYQRFVPWKEQMFARVRQTPVWRRGRLVKHQLKQVVAANWAWLRPRLVWAAQEARRRTLEFLGRARS